MAVREFVIYLDEDQRNRYRHRHEWQQGRVTGFRIQYEAFIAGRWHPVVRYDTAHGQPHKGTLHPDGAQSKEMVSGYSNADVLTIGQRDIMENWMRYRAEYEKEMG